MMNLLKSVNLWLHNVTGDEISYQAFREIVDNSAQVSQTRQILTLTIKVVMNLVLLICSSGSS